MSGSVDTVVSCLTPPGAAAIATLAITGPNAWPIVVELFRPISSSGQRIPEIPQPGQFWVGRFGESLADEVVLSLKSLDAIPCVELHAHGGREVVRFLLDTIQAAGARVCSWQDFAGLTADVSVLARAAIALARSTTSRTAGILLDQFQGAFSHAVEAILNAIDRGDKSEAVTLLNNLARYRSVGSHLPSGWRVVVAGAPNVGKSSLVNALAGYQRSIVSVIPGTTRDVVTTRIAVDGWPIELADTAGIRSEATTLESQGIERAKGAAESADLCLWVMDGSAEPVWPESASLALPFEKVRIVVNKTDLPAAWDASEAKDALHLSARTGTGLPELCQALADLLVPDVPPAGAAVPFTPELCERVDEALVACAAGRSDEARRILDPMCK